jgi:hypothetical protein
MTERAARAGRAPEALADRDLLLRYVEFALKLDDRRYERYTDLAQRVAELCAASAAAWKQLRNLAEHLSGGALWEVKVRRGR